MTTSPTFWLLCAALLVVLVLAAVAARLLWLLWRQGRRQRAVAQAQQQRLNESLQVLAQCVLTDQVGVGEASIRIRVLLDALQVDDAVREEFSAFYQLAAALDHLPTHGDWRALERGERRRLRRELEQRETDFDEFIRDAARRLIGREFGTLQRR